MKEFDMKITIVFLALYILVFTKAYGQNDFSIELKEIVIPDNPGIHSNITAHYDGKWLLIGGRTDGLHRRQPWASFQAVDNNKEIYVIDPAAKLVWSCSLDSLPNPLWEQLQSTNMQFEQRDSVLYVIGGYGYSQTQLDHTTFSNLVAINIPGLMQAIANSNAVSTHFRFLYDARLQITGGYLDRLDDYFYLVGGQTFLGRYNPMGPTHGSGFTQIYSSSIKKFKILDNGTSLSIADYSAIVDTMNLHRRDYNMVPQVFADGTRGFTAFTGVFQHLQDLPWLNTVDIRPDTFIVRSGFQQLLNQYHSANMPVFDSTKNIMYTIFFGGIGQYYFNATGNLVNDVDVPFVKTISMTVRYPADSMAEYALGIEMPAFLGAGAEFIPVNENFFDEQNILKLDRLDTSKILVGYINGGIESTAANIFFINDGTQSRASDRVFEVYLKRNGQVGIENSLVNRKPQIKLDIYPNPAKRMITVRFISNLDDKANLQIRNDEGKLIKSVDLVRIEKGLNSFLIDISELSSGLYHLTLLVENTLTSEQFVKIL